MEKISIFIVFVINAFILLLFFNAENFGIALIASAIGYVIFFPMTAVETLVIQHFLRLFTKKDELL